MEPQVIRIREQKEKQPLLVLSSELCRAFFDEHKSNRFLIELHKGVKALEVWIEGDKLYCTTSYCIGLAWVISGRLAVCVEPKMNRRPDDKESDANALQVDVLAMLKEALEDEANFDHLDGLQYIYPEQPAVPVKKEDQGVLLFLVFQFLRLVDRIRRQGLKRSFYSREEAFRYKKKGRIELSRSLRAARTPKHVDRLICSVQQFDVDTPANRYLKRALKKSMNILQQYGGVDEAYLEKVRQGLAAFEGVSYCPDAAPVRVRKVNPVFLVYAEALRLAELILAQASLGYEECQGKTFLPVHWIDMPKLFELYVFKKLREAVGEQGTLQYHYKARRQELDYLGRAPETEKFSIFVADAKYKPRYDETVVKDDLRQVSGYARLEKVVNELKAENRIIPCLIVYPPRADTESPKVNSINLQTDAESIKGWSEFYKVKVKLPFK